MMLRLLAGIGICCSLASGEQVNANWQQEVRRLAAAQDWTAAMRIVDRELARAPQDLDVRAWHARILAWSGSLADAAREYEEILAQGPADPDNWMALGNVYSRQGRTPDALRALERAVALDPKRADIRAAHGRLLRAANQRREAAEEFRRALALDPTSAEARDGLRSLRREPRHQLRVGLNTDFFNFTGANQDGGMSLASDWTPQWRTTAGWDAYERAGIEAGKLSASVTGKWSTWGALTVGGTVARDRGVIPQREAFFDYDHGWKSTGNGMLRGVELVYGQHWYWYTTSKIFTVSGTTLFYLPRDWTWSIAITGAQSDFFEKGVEWRPAAVTRLGFPIAGGEADRISGNVFFANGMESFAKVDQVGRFSAKTIGAGWRYRLTASQEMTGVAAYQMRSQDRAETSVGFSYGVRF